MVGAASDLHRQDSSSVENGAPAIPFHAAPLGTHAVSVETVGFLALARDLFHYEITRELPEALHTFIPSSKADEADWYEELHAAWKEAKAPPSNGEEAAQLVLEALEGLNKADVEGFLAFYGLHPSHASPAAALAAPSVIVPAPPGAMHPHAAAAVAPWPKGVLYEMSTIDMADDYITDGDSLTVYVETSSDAREAKAVPWLMKDAFERWRAAGQQNDKQAQAAVQTQIQKAGYEILDDDFGNSKLGRRYRVRLRGVDAPELNMPFGHEAKSILQNLVRGETLRLLVYNVDQYGRIVTDVWCDKGFVQEILLKEGACWYYNACDKRSELAEWENEARKDHKGLWAEQHPQKPWDYRKEHPRAR